jgi:hypothetical protein
LSESAADDRPRHPAKKISSREPREGHAALMHKRSDGVLVATPACEQIGSSTGDMGASPNLANLLLNDRPRCASIGGWLFRESRSELADSYVRDVERQAANAAFDD